jgi:8-oxo-dGTP pyrophosphatase MutT (NUDIX family)
MKQKDYILKLKERLRIGLPGQASHLKMLPLERRNNLPGNSGNPLPRSSSVLILLYPLDDYFGTLLIKRTEDLSVHSGQISFPGGKKDPEDQTPVHTALREAEEEIGITADDIYILGELSLLYVSPSNFEIHPVIGFVDQLQRLTPNPAEVEFIIELSLKNLYNLQTLTDLRVRSFEFKDVPCFRVNGHIVWGATAMILQELLDVMSEV